MKQLRTSALGSVFLLFALLWPLFAANARAQTGGDSWSGAQEQVAWWKNLYELFPTQHVQPDFTGLAKSRFRPPPEPYVHPRVYFNPEDVPDIRRRLRETEVGKASITVIREFVAQSLAGNEVYDGLAEAQKGKPFEDKLRQARWSLSIAMLYHGFLCLLDDDRAAAEKAARALTELARRTSEELANKPTSADGDWLRDLPQDIKDVIPAGQDWRTEVQGIVCHNNLALCYDFIYPWMTDAQRSIVRRMIAESSHDTWSHGMGVPGLNQGNWQPFHWRAGIQALAIEGEEGYDPQVVESTVRQMTQYYTYFFTKADAPLEGLGKGSLGTCYLPAFAKRGHWLIAFPGLRKSVREFLLHSLQPWGGRFHTYGGLGGAAGSVSAARNLMALKYAFPHDPSIDFVFRNAVGEQYETIRDGNVSGHYAQMYFYLYYAIFAEDFHAGADRSQALAELAPELTFFCPERAQLMTRSDRSSDALYLHFHVRQLQSSHVRDESGMFSLSALGRIWALYPAVHHRGPFGEAREARYHNVVTIDDACTGSNPGHMIDFADRPLATFATGDHRQAWDWVPADGEPQPRWVEDTSCPNDRIGLASARRQEPGFGVSWSEHSHWLRVGQKIGRRWKRPHYPVRHAFRSAGLVRGLHPYVMVVDDIRKDDDVHTYKWLMQLPDDLDVLRWDWEDSTEGFRADIILHEPSHDGANSQRRLLVRVLENAREDPATAINQRTNKPVTPAHIETYPAYGSTARGRRLVIPSRSVEPRFKVLLFPYREGYQLPSTSWYRDSKKLIIEWHDQRDVFLFDAGHDGRTRFVLQRIDGLHAEQPFALGKSVDKITRVQGSLIGHWTFDESTVAGLPTEPPLRPKVSRHGGDPPSSANGGLGRPAPSRMVVPDISGNNHPGKIGGGRLVPGVQGRCLRLNGSGRMELPPKMLASARQGISISFWLRPARADVPNSRLFSAGVHLREGFELNGYAGGVRASGLGDYWLGFTGRKLSRQWRHIVATCGTQEGLAAFYVNGRLVAEKEVSGMLRFDRAQHLIVGDGFEGEIDELRVYDYMLDEKEVASICRREGRYAIAHWTFDRLEDGWRLPSETSYDGVADKVTLAEGRFGRAVAFDGQGRIKLPKEVVTEHFRGALSVSLWFRTNAETIAGNSHLFNANEHLRNGLWVDFYGRGIRMNAAGGYGRCFSRDVTPGTWHHLVVTYDGTTGSMYLNGQRVAQSRFFGEFTLGRKLTVGGTGYHGEIDEVRLFAYPLSEKEVKRLFAPEAAGSTAR